MRTAHGVRTAEALAELTALAPDAERVSSELGTRGDAAYLRLALANDPGRWAVVWTPGDRWFSLDVDGGFCLDHLEDDIRDDDARVLLARYVEHALQYLEGNGITTRRSLLGFPVLELETDAGPVLLKKSISDAIRAMRHGRGR